MHGDDDVSSGPNSSLKRMRANSESKYILKTQILDDETHAGSELIILNRIIRLTTQGYEMEADPRHAQILI